MASQPPTAQKSTSRWGSFLAGVESRLDTILADEETKAPLAKIDGGTQEQPGKKDGMAVPLAAMPTPSRTASANRAQERLNEKLAKAMANRNLAKKGDTSVTPSGVPSRTASPANVAASPRTSSDHQRESKREQDGKNEQGQSEQEMASGDTVTVNRTSEDQELDDQRSEASSTATPPTAQSPVATVEDTKDESDIPRPSTDSCGSISARQSLELTRATTPNANDSPKLNGILIDSSLKMPAEYEKIIEQMRSDYEAAELRRQEETHIYLERIDALQSKLQYLTKEAAEVAKNASAEAQSGSIEHKMAAKDEKIALLIEEGQKLSQTELKHISIIKKLRVKSTEDDKVVADFKRTNEKYEKSAREAQERAKRAESAEKRALERLKSLGRIEKDLENVRADRDAKDSLMQDLQIELSQATSAAKEAEVKANAEALAAEKRHAADLTDELLSIKAEKELAEKQHQHKLRELKEKAEREKERAGVAEIERQGEQNILESRLEAYRARAEEASAGQTGDVQAKLLRQLETLQNQYAIASENWQGIEGSLLSRATILEKERDDIAKREADIRRKARETSMKSRRIEEELERVNAKTEDMDHELSSRSIQLATLNERLAKSEAEVTATREDLKAEREAWEARQAQRIEEEKARMKEENVRSNTPDTLYQQFRIESPTIHNRTRKSSNADRSPHARRIQGLAITGATSHPSSERPLSRRSSSQPLHNLQTSNLEHHRPVSRHDSLSTVPQLSVNNGVPGTPSGYDNDDFFDVQTPATPERTINDAISASTAGAGPSVQLVERMSAAVRRLESEKASHKDELSRLSGQRDEARDQIVGLMKEVDEKRGWESRVKELENEMKGVEERYLTTLEMLGEKSERVEELKADVQDLKGMYRELIENTMQ
ncbi:hypothetical protein HO133_002765 [Letharia lupina]|uniref:TATA element modulatory factor 1 TATA binding domain-containing protein n=1 Tax=Letharia lupina TaxID=560253 RepID=A0A8H6CCU7_9LECA|nr:uncharacterized protein HO133_002765 [Letharia lupina]KAF6221084.1 hypothetical protein HO133_002765 [Letharia lupina]